MEGYQIEIYNTQVCFSHLSDSLYLGLILGLSLWFFALLGYIRCYSKQEIDKIKNVKFLRYNWGYVIMIIS